MSNGLANRRVVSRADLDFRPYDRYGAPIPGMSWHPVTDERESGEASFFLKFEPGARSRPHEHVATEEFLMLEGELVDPDGRVFKAGDFVSYPPGSRHASHSPGGCVMLVFLRARNRTLEEHERLAEGLKEH